MRSPLSGILREVNVVSDTFLTSMEHPAGLLQKSKSKDSTFKVELPERHSTLSPLEKSPVSPRSNRVSSPGLESINNLPSEKEYCTPTNSAPEVDERPIGDSRKHKRWIVCVFALLLCIAIGLGVGLGVGLTRHEG